MQHTHYVPQIARRYLLDAWGGTESVIDGTTRALADRGYRADVLCPAALTDRREEQINGVHVRRFPYSYPVLGLSQHQRHQLDLTGGNLFSWSLLAHLLRLGRGAQRPSLFHVHTGKRLGGIVRLAARVHRIPYVVTLHGGYLAVPPQERERLIAPLSGTLEWGRALGLLVGSHRVLKDAAAVICLNDAELQAVQRQLPGQRALLLPNGVDSDRFARGESARFRRDHGIPDGRPVVLCVARIDPQKGQHLLVESLASIPHDGRRQTPHLVLIGGVTNEPYAAGVAQSAHALLPGRHTLIRGLKPSDHSLLDAYAAADLFALPSLHEPFGIVALEAWAAGKPVVASRVGGLSSLVEEGQDGLLVPAGEVTGLAAAIRHLLRVPTLGRAMGEAGRRKVRRQYDWTVVTAEIAALYDELIRGATK
jgi:glycosyltransferase involved in cell wall biosynthesis